MISKKTSGQTDGQILIHKFILKIQQILGCYELKDHTQNHWRNVWLSWICINMEKLNLFHLYVLEIQSVLESCDQSHHTHFWPYPPKRFLVKFLSICMNMQKSGNFINFFWRYNWYKSHAIWLAESILPHISGARFFSKMGFG